MAQLTNNTIASTYLGLLNVTGAIGTDTLESVTDGAGTSTSLSLSQQRARVTLGTSANDDFTIYDGSNDILKVEGDTKDVTLLDDLILISDSSIIKFGAGADLILAHDGGTGGALASAGALIVDSTATTLTLDGHTGVTVQSAAGTTDGTDAAGSILLSAAAGGIGLAWADGKDLWAEGGRFVVTANEDAADAIKLHADAGSSQTIQIVNDEGTGAAAIALTASAGGITVGLGGGSGDDFIVDTSTLVVESDNNRVGIGTATPLHDMHIRGDSSDTDHQTLLFIGDPADNDVGGYIGSIWEGSDPAYQFLSMGSSYYNGDNWITNYGSQWGSNNVAQLLIDADGIKFLVSDNLGSPNDNTVRTDSRSTFEAYEVMRVDNSDGFVGIGTGSPTYKLDVEASSSDYICEMRNTNTGAGADCLKLIINNSTVSQTGHFITCDDADAIQWAVRGDASGGAEIYGPLSDRRIKENIIEIPDALAMVNNLKPVRYNRKNYDASKYKYGFIADEFIDVFPHSVAGEVNEMEDVLDDDGNVTGTRIKPQSLATNNLFGVLTKAIQELSAKVTALENA